MLPYIDGVGVIEKCRECMEYEQLPVFIVLTSIGTEKLIECVNHMDIDYCMMRFIRPGLRRQQECDRITLSIIDFSFRLERNIKVKIRKYGILSCNYKRT